MTKTTKLEDGVITGTVGDYRGICSTEGWCCQFLAHTGFTVESTKYERGVKIVRCFAQHLFRFCFSYNGPLLTFTRHMLLVLLHMFPLIHDNRFLTKEKTINRKLSFVDIFISSTYSSIRGFVQ